MANVGPLLAAEACVLQIDGQVRIGKSMKQLARKPTAGLTLRRWYQLGTLMLFVSAPSLFAERNLRCVKIAQAAAVWAALVFSGVTYGASDLVDLRPPPQAGGFRQVRVVVEVEGKLKLNSDGKDVQHLPLKVAAELNYVERVFAQSRQWTDVRLIRSYQSAQAKLKLRDAEMTSALRPERRLIVVESNAKSAQLFSPEGPLTREELDLVDTTASGLALESLLPPRIVKIGSTWQLSDHTVARLLGLEAVNKQDCVATLDSAKDNLAVISLAGKVAGAAGGVSSEVELKGKLNFDLKQRAVTWLTLACRENRDIGHAQPGFETLTTFRLVSAPVRPAAELSDKALAGLPLASTSSTTLLDLTSESARYQLVHDRRWEVIFERPDATILRLVDHGDLIGQCNLSPLPPLGKGEQLSLEGFQDDVKRALGKNLEQVVSGGEEAENGIRILRVVVAGKTGDLPIQWTYYHLSDDHGRRAALVFTIESNLVERYPQIDRELIDGFRFLDEKQPTPALNAQPAGGNTVPQSAEKPSAPKALDR